METPRSPHASARDQLRIAFALFAAGATIGGLWDFAWHATNAFDSFLSPPHLTVYLSAAGAGVMLWLFVQDPATRGAFKTGKAPAGPLRLSELGQLDPGLRFAGVGMGVVLLSGLLDLLWHSAWGVDETRWSAPHAMFGWGLLVATAGFWSARINVAGVPPMGPAETSAFCFFTFSFAYYAFLLPYAVYPTQAALEGVANLEAVRASAGSDHTFRIYSAVGVSHFSAAYAVLTGLWAGTTVAICRSAGSSHGSVVAATLLFTVVEVVLTIALAAMLAIPPHWTFLWPAPLLAFGLSLAVVERVVRPSRALLVAATTMAALVAVPWVAAAPPSDGSGWPVFAAGVVAAVPLAWAGARAGSFLGGAIRVPRPGVVPRLALTLGIAPPLAYGALDLYLRWTIA